MDFPMPRAGRWAGVNLCWWHHSSASSRCWGHSGLEVAWSSPDGNQPACTSGGEAFYTIKQAMPFCIFFFPLAPVGGLGAGRALGTPCPASEGLLTSSDTHSPMARHLSKASGFLSLCSGWSIFLLRISLRVSTVLSSAVSHSSGGCISEH